jgi:hypothetical protein
MSDAPHAVFLSYASQDAVAAKKICDALRGAGVEVWFDQSELRGGDAWDAKIRKQIKDCALFVPLVSRHTNARLEGYFRLEWHLAERRMQHMHEDAPFLLPVVIDDVAQDEAKVPARFLEVQWMRLPGGETTPPFCARVQSLLTGGPKAAGSRSRAQDAGASALGNATGISGRRGSRVARVAVAATVAALIGIVAWRWVQMRPAVTEVQPQAAGAKAAQQAPTSEARVLANKARSMFEALDATRDDHVLAEDLIRQALLREGADAEIFAIEAQMHYRFFLRGWDVSDARRNAARTAAQKALRLDPQSFEARFAQAAQLSFAGREAAEKEQQLRGLRAERPKDPRVLRLLGETIERLGRVDESLPIFDEAAARPGGDPLALYDKSLALWFAGRTGDAEAALNASLAQKPFSSAQLLGGWYALMLHGDTARARAMLELLPPQALQEDRAAYFGFMIEYLDRHFAAARARLREVPRDWLNDGWHRGPKGRLIGDAFRAEGQLAAAEVEWKAALKIVDDRLQAAPNDRGLLSTRALLVARLGDREAAQRQAAMLQQMTGVNLGGDQPVPAWATELCVLLGRKADAIRLLSRGLKVEWHAVDYTSWSFKLDPDFDSLRSEPDFARLIAEAEEIERVGATPKPRG